MRWSVLEVVKIKQQQQHQQQLENTHFLLHLHFLISLSLISSFDGLIIEFFYDKKNSKR